MPMVKKMISKCEKTLSNAGFSLPLSAPVILQSSLANRSHGARLDQERVGNQKGSCPANLCGES